MQIHEILKNRRKDAASQIESLQNEIAEIDRLLTTSLDVPSLPPVTESYMTKDDAIIKAIKAGNRTPAQIADFMRNKLGVELNPASTRTRLSRMKADGKIKHDGIGWTL